MKLFKKYYLVMLLILCLSSGIIYGSYALYTTGADFSNVVNVGTDITYKFDINNTESIGVSNNSNFRFKGSLTNTIGSNMEYKFYYKINGNSTGVTVKEVTDGTMISSGSIANGETKTPEFYITNKSGGNITVTVGVNFAYSGNPVTLESGTNAITETIASSEAKTGNCTTEGMDMGDCTEECWTEYDSASGNGVEVCVCYTGNVITGRTPEEMLTYLGLTSRGEMTSVSSLATTDEGVWSAPDDYGTSYYFRGAVDYNFVKFAGSYWRIIRINGDGTIRMIFDGTSAHANGESYDSGADRQLASEIAFNPSSGDNAYVGYMYGSVGSSSYSATHTNTNSSTIKVALENWYKGLSEENKGYIADRVFCGDRKVASNISSFNGFTSYGYGTQPTVYEEGRRSFGTDWYGKTTQEISFICARKEDKYTADDLAIGNGVLDYPVGLITASEVRAAGGKTGGKTSISNKSYYLYNAKHFLTMSPSYFSQYSNAYVFYVTDEGMLNTGESEYTYGVRPVVSLKSDITFSGGNGSQGAPWIVGTGNA